MRRAQGRDGTAGLRLRCLAGRPAQRDPDRAAGFQLIQQPCALDNERRLLLTAIARAVPSGQQVGAIGADHTVQLGPRLREHQRLRRTMKILEREARVLGPRLLGDLPLHHRDHRGHRDLLRAPHPQRRGRPRPKKLHFGSVLGEGVTGNEEAKHRLFSCQTLVLGPGRDVGEGGGGTWGGGIFPKEPMLAGEALLLAHLRLAERMIQRGDQLGPLASQGVAGAGVDQRLDHALVAQPQVDAVAQLDERVIRRRLASRDDGGDSTFADIPYRAQSKSYPLITDDCELITRLVHVGREDLKGELTRFVDVLHDAIGVADFRRQQRRHEFGRIVDLEPGRLVREDRVGDGVRLVEAVAAERLDLRGDLLDRLLVVAARDGALHEVAQLLLDQLLDLLADRLAQHVGFGQRVAGQRARDAHDLFLIDDHAVRRRENLLERRMRVADLLAAELAVDEDEVHPGVERPGAQQGVRRHEVVEAIALHVAQAIRRQRRFKLEDARRAAGAQ